MRSVSILLLYLFSPMAFGQGSALNAKQLCELVQRKESRCQKLSDIEKLGLQTLQLQCEASFDKKSCDELAKKIPANAKDKIKRCDTDTICKGQTTPHAISCAIGGATFAWDTVVGLLTSPYEGVKFISDSFAKDQACFENKNGAKEALLNAFDSVIPDEHKQFRLSAEIKAAMLKQWPCREIQNFLITKSKSYQEFLGPLIAQGKHNAATGSPPLSRLIESIRAELGVRWDCYTPAAQAEMNCYILGSALTAGAGTALTLRSKLGKFGVSEEHLARVESALVLKQKPNNPQAAAWKMRAEGRIAEAQALEAQLIKDLSAGKVVGQPSSAGSGVNGAQYVKLDSDVSGVWKPTEVVDKNLNLITNQGAQHEVAAFAIDRKLGLNTVPVTVEKTLNGKSGSLQLRVESAEPPAGAKRQLAFFDDLISNADRNSGNIISSEGRVVAIDHGATFTEVHFPKEYTFRGQVEINLDAYKSALTAEQKNQHIKQLRAFMPEKEVYERLVTTPVDEWKRTLSPHLSPEKIRTFLDKRNKIIDAVEKARKEMGDQIFAAP